MLHTLPSPGDRVAAYSAALVLPVFAFVWAVAAPGGIRRRIAGR